MEYYILKLYQEAKLKDLEVEQGFNRYETKVKRWLIICMVLMSISVLEMIVTVIIFPDKMWCGIGMVLCFVFIFVSIWIDNTDEKKRINKYVNTHKKKLNILKEVLATEFGIDTREKVEELIAVYQGYINEKTEREKKNNRVIVYVCSGVGTILAIIKDYCSSIEMLIGVAFGIVFLSACVVGLISLYSKVDTLKTKYEIMVKDLKALLLIRY